MEITRELNLTEFQFWAGATQNEFTYTELKQIEIELEPLYPDGATETHINDLFWFEEEFICSLIGLDYEEYLER